MRIMLLIVLGFMSCVSWASRDVTSGETAKISEQRENFKTALKALRRGEVKRFRELEAELEDYILYPYLAYEWIKKTIHKQSDFTIELFLRHFHDTPLVNKMRVAWLLHLVKQKDRQSFLRFYKPGLSTNLTCRYMHYKLDMNTISDKELDEVARSIWFTGRSLPSSCDSALKRWQKSPLFTEDDVWQRLALALKSGKTQLVRHLSKLLPPESRELGPLWLKVRRYPREIVNLNHFTRQSAQENDILADGIRRLARKDLEAALRAWQSLSEVRDFNHAQTVIIYEALAYRLIDNDHPASLNWLDAVPERLLTTNINAWRFRYALRKENWELAASWFKQPLGFGDYFTEQALTYWQARIETQLGAAGAAEKRFDSLANKRDYYGFLASSILGRSPQLAHRPTPVDDFIKETLEKKAAVLRAKELLAIDLRLDARREWYFMKQDLSAAELKAAALIADEWEWHDRAIFTLAQAKFFDDVNVRFPLAYQREIEKASLQNNILPSWSFAITRQESAFMHDARSHAGATGLMQLMPYTAKTLARQMKRRYRGVYELLQPRTNIRYGTYYLSQLAKRHDGNIVYATASYNAGPHRVDKWKPEKPELALDIWIENIPFYETRKYVKRVLTYQVIYNQKLKGETNLIEELVLPSLKLEEFRARSKALAHEPHLDRPRGVSE